MLYTRGTSSEILKKCQRDGIVPSVIWMDEQDLIPSLKVVLKNACESVGVDEMIGVEWYPPPSEEERAFVEEHAYITYVVSSTPSLVRMLITSLYQRLSILERTYSGE